MQVFSRLHFLRLSLCMLPMGSLGMNSLQRSRGGGSVGVWCLVRTITWIAYCVDTDLALIVLIVLIWISILLFLLSSLILILPLLFLLSYLSLLF
ncbi:hypothetical protein C8J57DRAFT_1333691 [Mycena rebaudengoi]|nr:hypothetical protein C8J57DRAFT_1333691 [Mycena rebaudengoi]